MRGVDGDGQQPADASEGLWSAVVDDLIAAGGDVDRSLSSLATRLTGQLHCSSAVFLARSDGTLSARAFDDLDPERLRAVVHLFQTTPLALTSGPLAEVADSLQPRLLEFPRRDDSDPDYRSYIADFSLHSSYVVPLVAHGDCVGVLGLGRYGDQPRFSDADLATARKIAAVVAQILGIALLAERGQLADTVMAAMREAVIVIGDDGRIAQWNSGAAEMYGYESAEVLGQPPEDFLASRMHEEHAPVDVAEVGRSVRERHGWTGRLDQENRDGRPITVDSVITPLAVGRSAGAVIVNRDVTIEVEAGRRVRRQQQLAQAALDASPMLTAVVDDNGQVIAASRAWHEYLGAVDLVGMPWSGVVEALGVSDATAANLRAALDVVLRDEAPRTQGDHEMPVGDRDRTLSVHVSRAAGIGAVVTIADITDRASRERALSYSATHDAVTGLPNRGVLFDRAAHALTRAGRTRGMVALLFCDLDGFKELNDRFGHGTGDDILELFAARLVESCRSSDTVARVGGDEFAILLEDAVDESTAAQVAERIVAMAERSLVVPAGSFAVTTSVGVVVIKPDPDRHFGDADVDGYLGQADAAMYEAKRTGRNRWVMFDDAMRMQEERRGALVGDLVRGTRSGEFVVQYQPQFDAAGRLGGATARLRWSHPEQGQLEPFEVIAELGQIPLAIGDWMLGQSARVLAEWDALLPADFRLGVPLSRTQWMDRNTPDVVTDWLSRNRVAAARLRLEVPQEALAVDLDHSTRTARRYTEAGIDVAAQDFGAAALPLVDLARLPIGSVILGRRVVRTAVTPGEEDVLRGLMSLARRLGWNVIVRGIETDDQLVAVRSLGAALAQGYLLGRAAPAEEFVARFL